MSPLPNGRVVAVNTATEKGTLKTARASARLVAGAGVEGDAHAGPWHRQVSMLAAESIAAMQDLGAEVGPGSFGENVTTEGLRVQHLPIGSRLRVGPAMLEITQIGKECHDRCAIFAQVGDCVMPRDGVFARVVEGGVVRPGDGIVVERLSLIRAAVLTVSDKAAHGEREDESGAALEEALRELGVIAINRAVVPDERAQIGDQLRHWADRGQVNLILTTGGTGLTSRDVTPEATNGVLDRLAPGFVEAMRAASVSQTPNAMLSRAVSGLRGTTLIINMPGSPRACREQFAVVAPALAHAIEKLLDLGGDCAVRLEDTQSLTRD